MGSVGLHQATERRQGSSLPFKSIAQSTSLNGIDRSQSNSSDHALIFSTLSSAAEVATHIMDIVKQDRKQKGKEGEYSL
jgi:hypothetical protein